MVAGDLGRHAETIPFPALMDATLPEASDPTWQGFRTASVANMTAFWTAWPLVKAAIKRWPYEPAAATGPVEAITLPITLDATEDSGSGLTALEIAAELGDEEAFVEAASEIDWSQCRAVEFTRAVRLALAVGAHLLARHLAAQGAKLHPDHAELERMARILAPPRVVRADLPSVPSLQANQAWLRAHADEYRGQWVALRDGALLAAAATARQLRACLESTDGVLITRVF
ncbi:MAG: hypothetical protein DRI79_13275 [Chloroflexi bacterium]|nr:MAG: hypothetical protein DRI79_13275 [Chloroflexota bacterium]